MDKDKKLSIVSTILAVILSDLMSAHVAIVYCNEVNLIKYEGSSASASFPFLVAIPYIIMILGTLTNSYRLWIKSEPIKKGL
jgi:hypothetical protein